MFFGVCYDNFITLPGEPGPVWKQEEQQVGNNKEKHRQKNQAKQKKTRKEKKGLGRRVSPIAGGRSDKSRAQHPRSEREERKETTRQRKTKDHTDSQKQRHNLVRWTFPNFPEIDTGCLLPCIPNFGFGMGTKSRLNGI